MKQPALSIPDEVLYPIIIWMLAIIGALLASVAILFISPYIDRRRQRKGKTHGRHL